MAASPPPGYLNRKVAQSVEEAVQSYTVDHIKTIVKAAIQRYIESFMLKTGGNRSLYETFTKMGLQYIVDRSFDPASDPTLRKTQLARLFEQIHRELPAILIVDTQFEYVPANFTGLSNAKVKEGFWMGSIQIVRQLSVSVIAATRDQSSTDFLQGLISVMFGEMRFLAGGTRLTGNVDKGESWVMTLNPPKLGTVSQEKVTDDPKDTIWSFSVELPEILFEDTVYIKQPIQKVTMGDVVVNPNGYMGIVPEIFIDDRIPINEGTRVLIEHLQPEFHRVVVSDPNIATYEPLSQIVTPRRLGTFQIQILRSKDKMGGPDGAMEVIASKTIRVIPA